MADLFDTPYSEVLSQGIQLLQGTMRARQQLLLQREKFEQEKKEHDDKVRLEEEKLKIERETLDLKTQAAAAKAAGGPPNAAMIASMRKGTEEKAVSTLAQVLPPELQQFAGLDENAVRSLEQTATAKLQALQPDLRAKAFQDNINKLNNMPVGQNHPAGPIGAQEKALSDIQTYRQYLQATNSQLVRQHPYRSVLEGEAPAPPEGTAAAPTPPETLPAVNASQANAKLDSMLAGAVKPTGEFVEPAGLGSFVADTGRDLMAAGQQGAVNDMFARLKTAGVPASKRSTYFSDMMRRTAAKKPPAKKPQEF